MNEPYCESNPKREFVIDYQKWRGFIYKTNYLCMAVVLFTEIVMFFIFRKQNLFLQPIPVYLFRFLILPTMINLGLIMIGRILRRVLYKRERLQNAIPVCQLMLLCFIVCCVHHVFSVTFCTFSFPIFLSAIFCDKRLTRVITGFSFVLLTAAQFVGPSFNDVYSIYLIPEYFVATIALLASALVCSILSRFQEEKNGVIEAVYQSRLEAIGRLNLDQKTGLYGVTAFRNQLAQLLEQNPEKQNVAIAMLDIDDFKQVNDCFGHTKGDEVILRLAELMKKLCGERFFPVRFGGEEFVILFSGGEWAEYRAITKRLLVEFASAEYDFTDKTISVSAGISQWMPNLSGDELFNQADKALYESKASGKNQLTVYIKDFES